MKYTDLIFDLYGTLVDIHTDENDTVWEKTAVFFGFYGAHYTPETLKAAFNKELSSRESKAGQAYECFPDIPIEQIFAVLFREKGVRNSALLGLQAAQMFRIASMEYIRLYPNVVEALTALRERGFRLWLLSNAQRAFTAYELRHLGLDRAFDGIYLSSDYGCRKPDSRFYHALIEEQKLQISNCLMIGNDRFTDIAGARKLSMATLYMHTNLTPADQAPADAGLHPRKALSHCCQYEFEGSDWEELTEWIVFLCNS